MNKSESAKIFMSILYGRVPSILSADLQVKIVELQNGGLIFGLDVFKQFHRELTSGRIMIKNF